jgi:hypothetical protein
MEQVESVAMGALVKSPSGNGRTSAALESVPDLRQIHVYAEAGLAVKRGVREVLETCRPTYP